MKPPWKQVKCDFNLYLLYEESEMMMCNDKDHMSALRLKKYKWKCSSQLCSNLYTLSIDGLHVHR